MSGAILANENTVALQSYAQSIGLAFQIQDDVLDVLGDAKKAGKKLQKDADAGKATFVSLLGLEEARAKATSLVEDACDSLSAYGDNAEPLRQVAQFVVNRDM